MATFKTTLKIFFLFLTLSLAKKELLSVLLYSNWVNYNMKDKSIT